MSSNFRVLTIILGHLHSKPFILFVFVDALHKSQHNLVFVGHRPVFLG